MRVLPRLRLSRSERSPRDRPLPRVEEAVELFERISKMGIISSRRCKAAVRRSASAVGLLGREARCASLARIRSNSDVFRLEGLIGLENDISVVGLDGGGVGNDAAACAVFAPALMAARAEAPLLRLKVEIVSLKDVTVTRGNEVMGTSDWCRERMLVTNWDCNLSMGKGWVCRLLCDGSSNSMHSLSLP